MGIPYQVFKVTNKKEKESIFKASKILEDQLWDKIRGK